MTFLARLLSLLLLVSSASAAGFPVANESLNYTVVWPSGLSLGEANLSAAHSGNQWTFDLKLSASVPGFTVNDTYHSVADSNLCAAEFDRTTSHGSRKAAETTTIANGTAIRQTANGGGKTEISVGDCTHDALTFLFFARRELSQGKVPPAQKIIFGNGYQIALQYTGLQTIKLGDASVQADRVVCSVGTNYTFEVYFAKDAARTPLLVRVPFALGAFSMELVR